MKNDVSQVINLWKQEVSDHISKYKPYEITQQLNQMAALFTPGLYYYYVFNFFNMKMEFVSPGTKEMLGVAPEDFTIVSLLEMFPPAELEMMKKKEALVADFFFRFLAPEEIPFYKVIYFMPVRNKDGNYRNILHQTTTLTVSETGKVEHTLGIHTDVSHLTMAKNDKVSLIHLKGGRSYLNIDPEKGQFDPEDNSEEPKLRDLLTKREVEVIKLLAEGLKAEEIAKKLFISFNTIHTHRKNLLKKSGCANTTELVARCLVEGVI